ncbi:uncharacterized protein BP5553_02791 [Venustampulla echinocandica]|uniref:protein-ribulosamine 3-kinase n=1 Tax=Venustampulla echinocandica TaxID=2656787 RepID=A0A370TSE6_9HELO|nr:uncharacterized protein BP5553_02791 [Venustampulla echinocandica]RDL38451.1 hypothetical protein BP5553_02791 [Venustampulla echinocandica]
MPGMNVKSSARRGPWSLADSYGFIASFVTKSGHRGPRHFAQDPGFSGQRCFSWPSSRRIARVDINGLHRETATSHSSRRQTQQRRHFHSYFVTNLPSSSLHPDSRPPTGPHHKLPRSASTPHTPGSGPSPAAAPPMIGTSRELTVVRIPLRSAKHHFGVFLSRGTRPYNEDTYQAGTLEIPAFAKRAPISLSRSGQKEAATGADSASGDPQVFYFGVFDGHGGNECSDFLREELHNYIESTAKTFELGSSLKKGRGTEIDAAGSGGNSARDLPTDGKESLQKVEMKGKEEVQDSTSVTPLSQEGDVGESPANTALEGGDPEAIEANEPKAVELERSLLDQWKDTVGGYFKRFRPDFFSLPLPRDGSPPVDAPLSIESVLMYSFLKADLDFVTAQARKPDPDAHSDEPLNAEDILGEPAYRASTKTRIGGPTRFIGGSTASIALISTPTPTPFWHPASPSSLITAHVGDTRVILCDTATGLAKPLTTNHHPSAPVESTRLRRYAATFVTDSFGEERMSGLANTRSFGDMRSKRIGVSAEPEIRRVELAPAEYSFLVLVSDGVSGTLSDQEIVDVVKEAKTPEQGAGDVVSFATEVTREGDNATCLVVRLGGWERRGEGGLGSLGTKEVRDYRRGEAADPRRSRTLMKSPMTPPIDPAILSALSLHAATTKISSHGGSGFSSTFKLSSNEGHGEEKIYFVKIGKGRGSEVMFAGEHASLNGIHTAVPSLCPKSHAHGPLSNTNGSFLATDFLSLTSAPSSGQSLAQKLAKLHSTPAPIPDGYGKPVFGFPVATCCGDTEQDNGFEEDWSRFYAARRLGGIGREIERKYGADGELAELISKTSTRIAPRLLSSTHLKSGQTGGPIIPVVVHGDLWSGNHGRGSIGGGSVEEVVYDPSSCWAHSEFEFGIMRMFGGFGGAFEREYESYKNKDEPKEEWEDRVKLYELYHHLNHYAIFGGSYRSGAVQIMKSLIKKYG